MDLRVFYRLERYGKKATQPCPCGFYNHPDKDCVCSSGVVKRYLNKTSGPLLEKIDLHVEVTPVSYEELADYTPSKETSEKIVTRVIKARKIQTERFKDYKDIHSNAQMPSRMICEMCQLNQVGITLLK